MSLLKIVDRGRMVRNFKLSVMKRKQNNLKVVAAFSCWDSLKFHTSKIAASFSISLLQLLKYSFAEKVVLAKTILSKNSLGFLRCKGNFCLFIPSVPHMIQVNVPNSFSNSFKN